MGEEVRSYSSCSIAGMTSGWRLAANTFQVKFNNSFNLVMGGQKEGQDTGQKLPGQTLLPRATQETATGTTGMRY